MQRHVIDTEVVIIMFMFLFLLTFKVSIFDIINSLDSWHPSSGSSLSLRIICELSTVTRLILKWGS